MCMADVNSTNSSNTSLNITETSGKNLSVQKFASGNYVKGYDMEHEQSPPIPDSENIGISIFELAVALIVIGGIGTFYVVALLIVFAVILKSAKKK
ncbi:hypothetical protein MettiDRAFT_2505 [Methanolobus tindarius DSM 2278]|uniref:Uncharacterized protein n=2 Tax=Methanolobus tindarius TaxID=2221 RepID=W9DTQ2_METTI|nr:hypothetical protein MettiDRAFT_2505 [Methanolobus tindarius DSM 2278]